MLHVMSRRSSRASLVLLAFLLLTGCGGSNEPTRPKDLVGAVAVVTVSTPAGTEHEMVLVPAGEFRMGSGTKHTTEGPEHPVELLGYWIDKYEVTNAQYSAYYSASWGAVWEYRDKKRYHRDPQQAVVGVPWDDAVGYCRWAGLRLPTEAEWEKAARGTDGRTYPWGEEMPTCKRAVMDDGEAGCGQGEQPWVVGSMPKGVSPYGVHDMAGNVSEWVSDTHLYPRRPPPPPDDLLRVYRGGSYYSCAGSWPWKCQVNPLRCAYRASFFRSWGSRSLGFRCAQDE